MALNPYQIDILKALAPEPGEGWLRPGHIAGRSGLRIDQVSVRLRALLARELCERSGDKIWFRITLRGRDLLARARAEG